jgi:hypothetical protein
MLVGGRLWIAVVSMLLGSVGAVQATVIEYVATDLADDVAGEDRWRYDYTVSGRSFLESEFFDILFDPALYRDLAAGPAPNADWDVLILQQPNPANLPPFDAGIFDAFAVVTDPSLAGTFSASFVYLGMGVPGPQVFQVYDAGADLVETGLTRPLAVVPIPEPSTILLTMAGLGLVCGYRRTISSS